MFTQGFHTTPPFTNGAGVTCPPDRHPTKLSEVDTKPSRQLGCRGASDLDPSIVSVRDGEAVLRGRGVGDARVHIGPRSREGKLKVGRRAREHTLKKGVPASAVNAIVISARDQDTACDELHGLAAIKSNHTSNPRSPHKPFFYTTRACGRETNACARRYIHRGPTPHS